MRNDLADFAACLKRAAALAEKQPPCMSLLIDEEGLCVDLVLDTKQATISEWIKGEGADICLYRDRDTGKVVGCHLPLYQKELRVSRIEKPKSKGRSVMPDPNVTCDSGGLGLRQVRVPGQDDFEIEFGGLRIRKNGQGFFNAPAMTFSDVDYVAAVAIEQLMLATLNKLGAVGVARVVAAGKADELRAFGVDVPGA